MKKSLLLATILMTYLGQAQCVDPLLTDFECSAPSHPLIGALNSIANPFSSGINTSATVGQYTDDGTAQFDNLSTNYGAAIDLSVNSVLHIKVYTQLPTTTPIPLVAKLEGAPVTLEVPTSIDVTGEWKEYTFDFSSVAGEGNTTLVLFFNAFQNNGSVGDTYYIDDIFFAPPASPPTMCADPIITDFECDLPAHPITGALVTITNSFPGGINTSANIGQYTDDGTAGFDALLADFITPIDLTTNNVLKIKLYTPTSIQILAKLEGGTTPQEIYSDFSMVNTWEEFSFDFSASAGAGNTRVVLFFNPTVTSGTTTDLYYIDDFKFESSTLSIAEETIDNIIKVYPNPTRDVLNLSATEDKLSYQILDVLGKTVVPKTNANSNTINVSHLKAGIYFLRLDTATTNKVIKFVKQ